MVNQAPELLPNDVVEAFAKALYDYEPWEAGLTFGEIAKYHADAFREMARFVLRTVPALTRPTPSERPVRTTAEIEQILFSHFYTGEPGEHEAIKAAAAVLTSDRPVTRVRAQETRFQTDKDREYAIGVLDDLEVDHKINPQWMAIITQWFCKARVETVRRVASERVSN